jgi:hypothetical protein
MMMLEELFLDAVHTYKEWWACGRDFNLHTDKFEAWDMAINTYSFAAMISRDEAINQVRAALGMSNQI